MMVNPASGSESPSSPALSGTVLHLVSHTPTVTSPSDTTSGGSLLNRTTSEASSSGVSSFSNGANPSQSPSSADWVEWYASGQWLPTVAPPVPPSLQDAAGSFPTTPIVDEVDFDQTSSTAEPSPSLAHQELSAPVAKATSGSCSSRATDSESFGSSFEVTSPNDFSNAKEVLSYFKTHGYLPGPKNKYEQDRLRIIRRYDLDSPKRRESIDRICRIAKAYFVTNTIIITLVFDGHTVFAAEAGMDPSGDPGMDEPVRKAPLDTSLCAHGMTRVQDKEVWMVPDLSKDWRFKNNPQSVASGGNLAFYASAAIHLPTVKDPSNQEEVPETLPVGSICVLSDKPQTSESFTAEHRQILRDLSVLVAEQFSLGYEKSRREREKVQTDWLGAFLDQALMQPLDPAQDPNGTLSPVAPTTTASQSQTLHSHQSSIAKSFQEAAQQLLPLTGATSAAILDLRSFRLPQAQRLQGLQFSEVIVGDAEYDFSTLGDIFLLGSEGNIDWEELMAETHDRTLARAIIQSIARWQQTQQQAYIDREPTPFTPLLPEHVSATTIVPIAEVDGVISLMLVLTSSTDHFVFEPADQKFASNVGSVLASALLRERAQRADNAKLAFVSQVSHELRTPIFAVASQLELLREFSTPTELQKIRPMLDVADVCLDSLRDVLDDTLDVAKFSNSNAEMTAHQKSALARTDLSKLAAEVAQACFIRKRRSDLVTTDESEMSATAADSSGRPSLAETAVDLILEVEDRPGGWTAWVDVGGMKRVLLNLLGNSLKFTERGHVKMTLRDVSGLMSGQPIVTIEVEDTGCGMSEEFLRSGSVFTPFMQENPFITGAGLGLSICQTIFKRMNGTIDVVATGIGRGTTFRITLPLEFASPASSPSSPGTPVAPTLHRQQQASPLRSSPVISTDTFTPVPRTRDASAFRSSPLSLSDLPGLSIDSGPSTRKLKTRIISKEILALFTPGTGLAPAPSPYIELPELDFSAAVDAAQVALGTPALKRVPSSKVKRSQRSTMISKDSATTIDLVDEVAKLSIATTLSPGSELSSPPIRLRPELLEIRTLSSDVRATRTLEDEATKVSAPKTLRVLFADDNPIARNILAKVLQGKGVAYVAAVDGDDAVQKFENEGPFQLLLFDVQMPNKDGIGAAFEIRQLEKERNLPPSRIIALSGLSNEADMRKAGVLNIEGPIDHWIVKGNKSLRQVMTEVMASKTAVERGSSSA